MQRASPTPPPLLTDHLFHQRVGRCGVKGGDDHCLSPQIIGWLAVLYCLGATSAVSLDPPLPRTELGNPANDGAHQTGSRRRGGVGGGETWRSNHLKTAPVYTHTGACAHTLEMRACFIMTSFEHCTSRQCPITHPLPTPLNTLPRSQWLHPALGRKGHTIKWPGPSVRVTEW